MAEFCRKCNRKIGLFTSCACKDGVDEGRKQVGKERR